MKYSEIIQEKRSHPEQNIKFGIVDFLRQYKDDPKVYIHTTNLLKVGIYPRSSDGQDSPVGIYHAAYHGVFGINPQNNFIGF